VSISAFGEGWDYLDLQSPHYAMKQKVKHVLGQMQGFAELLYVFLNMATSSALVGGGCLVLDFVVAVLGFCCPSPPTTSYFSLAITLLSRVTAGSRTLFLQQKKSEPP